MDAYYAMNPLEILWFTMGLFGLYWGAEWMVTGASRLAGSFGIRPMVVGLTVVAFGTSSPELAVSLIAVFEESDGIAIGNIIGSNIANIGLILGASALVSPLRVEANVLRRELPIMIGVSLLFIALLFDGQIDSTDGALLFAGLVGYLAYQLRDVFRRNGTVDDAGLDSNRPSQHGRNALMVVAGLGLLVAGANLMIESGIVIARLLGISEVVIGIALVAVGTSLPELATSMVSALRGQSDISVGNIIGSNIFNVMCVVGVVSMIMPLEVDRQLLFFELPVMMAFSLVLIPFMRTGFVLNRWEGGLLLAGYAVFIFYLF